MDSLLYTVGEEAFQVPLPLYISTILPLSCRDLHMACHGCRLPKCNPLLILNKPIFAGEISGSLFVLGQQPFLISPYKHFPILPCTHTFTNRRRILNDVRVYIPEFEKSELKEKKGLYEPVS